MTVNETGGAVTCEQVHILISRALDGDLDAHELTELAAHTARCPACQLRAIEFSEVDSLLRELDNKVPERYVPRASFTQQLMQRVGAEVHAMGGLLEFSQLVAQDPDLQNQFRPAASMEMFVELFVSVGWQRGYRFGSGEVVSLLTARQAANDDLSDEQLNAVVGGVGLLDAKLTSFIEDVLKNWPK